MRVLIIEDEERAATHLGALLRELDPFLLVVGAIESVSEGLALWPQLPAVDLIFSDIQLADGLSFSLLERVQVPCPIIFTTAYDEYAIRAFKLNSIDYLLKPIEREALHVSLQKYRTLTDNASSELVRQVQQLMNNPTWMPRTYRSSFLIPFRDKLLPLSVSDIAYFSIEGGVVSATIQAKGNYPIEQKLEELELQLDPRQFFRANRQFIVARSSIREAELYFNGRLLLKLLPDPGTPVLISKERVSLFKKWMES